MMEGTARNYANPPPEILEYIFSYLNARDLGSAAMVCRSWSQEANREKSIRGPCCFSIGLRICKERTSLDKIENMRIKPSAGFFFIPYNTLRNIEDHIEDLLPDHCEVIMLYGESVILENDEMERFKFPIVCAFLPQIPNVRIKSFPLAKLERDCVIQESAEYREIIKAIVDHETSISNHETSTCFMLFSKLADKATAADWASAMQESKEVKIASVWGGELKDIYIQRTYKTKKRMFRRKDAPGCVAVLITGAIQTWSTILDRECNTKERVEARLNLFKDEVKLKKHSIGFMLVCETHETAMYRESNVESTIFRRLFPKVPLAGTLAGCLNYRYVFGKTTTVNEANEENNDEEEHECWYNKNNCTVFLILTYG